MTGRPSKKIFSLANPTAPTAEPQVTAPQTSRRPDVPPPAPASEVRRSAFTWRQSPREQDALEDLVRLARRATGRRVDKADVLAALVDVANERDDIRGTLFRRLGV